MKCTLGILGPGNHGWGRHFSHVSFFCHHIGTKKHSHFTMGNTLLKHLRHNNSFGVGLPFARLLQVSSKRLDRDNIGENWESRGAEGSYPLQGRP